MLNTFRSIHIDTVITKCLKLPPFLRLMHCWRHPPIYHTTRRNMEINSEVLKILDNRFRKKRSIVPFTNIQVTLTFNCVRHELSQLRLYLSYILANDESVSAYKAHHVGAVPTNDDARPHPLKVILRNELERVGDGQTSTRPITRKSFLWWGPVRCTGSPHV